MLKLVTSCLMLIVISNGLFTPLMAAEPAKFSGMLWSHNKVRAKHKLPALEWSGALAGYAQQWANELANNRRCTMQHRPDFGPFKQRFGENIFWASPEQWSDGRITLQKFTAPQIVSAWAEEESYYNYHTNQCQKGEDCGHYTQMVWKESRKVGCAIAVCKNKAQLWVCNYDPPGNYYGERPY